MATPKTIPGPGAVNGMVRRKRGKRWDFQQGTIQYEVWEGDLASADAFFAKESANNNWHNIEQGGPEGSTICTVRLEVAVDPDGWDPTLNATWEVNPIEIVKDLRVHPYWRRSANFPILPDMIQCDNAIARGELYDPTTSVAWAEQMKRYYALRMCGVDSYIEYGLEITSTIMVSSKGNSASPKLGAGLTAPLTTPAPEGSTQASVMKAEYKDANRAVKFDTIGVPGDAIIAGLDAITRLKRLDIIGGVGTAPDFSLVLDVYPRYTDDQYEPSKWEWLKCMPSVRTERAGKRLQVTRRWRGATEISTVLYGGNWDPKYQP